MRQTVFLCDLHEGSVTATRSVHVLVDDVTRRLDVCDDHAAWLGGLPDSVADAGSADGAAVPGTGSAGTGSAGTGSPGTHTRAGSRRMLRAERAAARDWARTQGAEVAERGRLPTGLLERYREQAG